MEVLMPTIQEGKRPGRSRRKPADRATSQGIAKLSILPYGVQGVDVVAEVQTVDTDGTGGDFTLTLNGQETAAIAYNATTATMDTRIQALAAVTAVTVTGSTGGPWVITFNDGLGPLGIMTADDTGLTGETTGTTVVLTTDGVLNVFEAFALVTEGDTGTFTIVIDGNASAGIDEDDDADAIEILVEAITGITAVECTGLGTRKSPFIVTFANPAGDVDTATSVVTSWTSTIVAAGRQVGPGDRE